MSLRKDERLQLPALGELYDDILAVDAWINNRSKVAQGQNLLCTQLEEREPKIRERVAYLAQKRNITPEEMWTLIVTGKATRMSPAEMEGLTYKPGNEG